LENKKCKATWGGCMAVPVSPNDTWGGGSKIGQKKMSPYFFEWPHLLIYLLRCRIKFHPQTPTEVNQAVSHVGARGHISKCNFILICEQVCAQVAFIKIKMNLNQGISGLDFL